MYDKYIPIILPLVWVVVSTVIALILYRTSEAFFEQKVSGRHGAKRIRLVGSVVIAAVVFLGLARFTPVGRFDEKVSNESRVSTAALDDQEEAIVGVRQAFEETKACSALASMSECQARITELESRIVQLERARHGVSRSEQ